MKIFYILASLISVIFAQMSDKEWNQNKSDCILNQNSIACQAIIDNGLLSVAQCDKSNCDSIGIIYEYAGHTQEAIEYCKKAIALGDYYATHSLGILYYKLENFADSFKYESMACEKIPTKTSENKVMKGEACYNLGNSYNFGKGTRQDYFKASQFYKKACDLGNASGCNNLGYLYRNGQGVKQNKSTAKHYYGKTCDLGEQLGCDNYKKLNEIGVK